MRRPKHLNMPRSQHGLSLVELMIALLLGLLITAAATQMLLTTKNAYRMQDDISRLQENGRFAVELLSHDIRMAGYMGCANISRLDINIIAKNASDWDDLNSSNFLLGYDNVTVGNSVGAKAGSDYIQIRGASGGGVRLYPELTDNANIQIKGNPYGFEANDVLMVTHCVSADIFRATNVSTQGNNNDKVTIAHTEKVNTANRLSKLYGPDAEIMFFRMVTYYVKPSETGSGDALWMKLQGADTDPSTALDVEIVDGVENLQIEYGVDTNGDRAANEYRAANNISDWSRVVSVRFSLLMAGNGTDTINTSGNFSQSINYNGAAVTKDGKLRSVFENLVAIRNRVP